MTDPQQPVDDVKAAGNDGQGEKQEDETAIVDGDATMIPSDSDQDDATAPTIAEAPDDDEGDSEDDNKQAAEQVADLQKLTQMHGNPSLLVLCHPIKAARDQKSLEPRGGGAFLNQIDANLTVWKADEGLTQLSWAKKIRGAGFAPINIKITEVPLKDCVMKQSGKPITTVIAEPIEPSEVRELVKDNRSIEDNVLLAMFENSGISIREIARRLNWSEGQKGKIERALQALKKDKLVTKHRRNDPYELSAMGKKEAQALIERGVELPPLKF